MLPNWYKKIRTFCASKLDFPWKYAVFEYFIKDNLNIQSSTQIRLLLPTCSLFTAAQGCPRQQEGTEAGFFESLPN
jgi:hypothetical protein